MKKIIAIALVLALSMMAVCAMADAKRCPVSREMPEKMKEKLDNYLGRKRPKDA